MPNSVPIVSTASPVPSMNIEIRDLSTAHPYEKNPRLNDKEVNVDGVIIVSSTEPQSSDCGVIPSRVEFVQGPAVEIRLVPEHGNAYAVQLTLHTSSIFPPMQAVCLS